MYAMNRVAQLYSRALGSLYVASCESQGYGGGILTRLHTDNNNNNNKFNNVAKVEVMYITTDGRSAVLSWCQAPIWTRDQFFLFLKSF
jgi:hypothetical protein